MCEGGKERQWRQNRDVQSKFRKNQKEKRTEMKIRTVTKEDETTVQTDSNAVCFTTKCRAGQWDRQRLDTVLQQLTTLGKLTI